MKAHWGIIQGSIDWHYLRYGKIGGTASKGLLVDSDTLLDDLISCRLEPLELDDDAYQSSEMIRGSELEPMARIALSEYSGHEFKECGWIQSDINIIGISPDGLTQDMRFACEIKCPSRKKHTQTLRGKSIPSDNLVQCVHYFTVNPLLERLYFGSFRPESQYRLAPFILERESMVNLGTKAKPVCKTVNEWAAIMRCKAIEMETLIQVELDKLGGI